MDIREAPGWVWAVVMIAIFAAIGVLILDEFSGTLEENSTQWTVTQNGTTAIANVTKQLPTVGIIVGVLLIVGAVVLIARYFGTRQGYT